MIGISELAANRTNSAARSIGVLLLALIAASVTAPRASFAQSITPVCTANPAGPVSAADACNKIYDLFQFLTPQLGVALAGGNTMPGETGTIGRPGGSSAALRLSVVDGYVPENTVNLSPTGSATSSDYGAQRVPIPVPTLDFAFSLLQGKATRHTNIGGLDLLAGITYVPDVTKERVNIRTDGRSFALSYGLRLGVFQESRSVPGVSISYRRRKLPTSSFGYLSNNDTLNVNRTSITVTAWRAVAGKHFGFVGIAGGVGRDDIDSHSEFDATINEPAPVGRLKVTAVIVGQKVKRNTAFANLSLGPDRAKLVGEMGWSSEGETLTTVNTFGGRRANEGYRYYTLGFLLRY